MVASWPARAAMPREHQAQLPHQARSPLRTQKLVGARENGWIAQTSGLWGCRTTPWSSARRRSPATTTGSGSPRIRLEFLGIGAVAVVQDVADERVVQAGIQGFRFHGVLRGRGTDSSFKDYAVWSSARPGSAMIQAPSQPIPL